MEFRQLPLQQFTNQLSGHSCSPVHGIHRQSEQRSLDFQFQLAHIFLNQRQRFSRDSIVIHFDLDLSHRIAPGSYINLDLSNQPWRNLNFFNGIPNQYPFKNIPNQTFIMVPALIHFYS